MKRVVKADTAHNESVHNQLVRQLEEDLNNSFEDNIVMKYAIYINDDPSFDLDRTDQHTAWLTLMRARRKYLEAMAYVIQYVDVDDMLNL